MELNLSALTLAQRLLSFKTMQPEGSEQECADHLAALLEKHGFRIEQHAFEANRPTLVAELDGNGDKPPICFAGHMDTVPLGAAPWQHDPFQGEVDGDKLYGRGAADMKCGIAAVVIAALNIAKIRNRKAGLKLIFTAGEELGCKGSLHLANLPKALGPAGALVVAEPTSNRPSCCHRGALWVEVSTRGKTAHGALPHLGENAIYKAVDMIIRAKNFDFKVPAHLLLGSPTMNVGTITGGQNINSVPDQTSFTMDIRTLPGQSHDDLLQRFHETLGEEADINTLVDLAPVETDPDHPWMREVRRTAERILGKGLPPEAKQAFTDAAALTPAFGHCPTVILGPGDQEMCHKIDEYCLVSRIDRAVEIYTQIIKDWCA